MDGTLDRLDHEVLDLNRDTLLQIAYGNQDPCRLLTSDDRAFDSAKRAVFNAHSVTWRQATFLT